MVQSLVLYPERFMTAVSTVAPLDICAYSTLLQMLLPSRKSPYYWRRHFEEVCCNRKKHILRCEFNRNSHNPGNFNWFSGIIIKSLSYYPTVQRFFLSANNSYSAIILLPKWALKTQSPPHAPSARTHTHTHTSSLIVTDTKSAVHAFTNRTKYDCVSRTQ
jgi:hypothetical protein